MTDAEIAVIREQLQHACPECQGHWECDDMRALLAHIDAQAAEVERLSAYSDAQAKAMHPDYGPCDAIAGGACAECLKIVKERDALRQALGEGGRFRA